MGKLARIGSAAALEPPGNGLAEGTYQHPVREVGGSGACLLRVVVL